LWQSPCSLPAKGYFCRPTLFLNCPQSHRVVQEEIFGPVLAVQTCRTAEEAVEKANNTPYGVAGGVWSDKGSKIFKVTSMLRTGVVWANTYNKFDPTARSAGIRNPALAAKVGYMALKSICY